MTALLDLREHLPITNPTWIFFLVLCIILFAPVLLNKLKIPHLIGMILAGILIGEHGFDILARDSSFELFGQVGLYYIMFLAGLEMNMEDFPAIRGHRIWDTRLYHSYRLGLFQQHTHLEIWDCLFHLAGEYVRLAHTHFLSHRYPIRSLPAQMRQHSRRGHCHYRQSHPIGSRHRRKHVQNRQCRQLVLVGINS